MGLLAYALTPAEGEGLSSACACQRDGPGLSGTPLPPRNGCPCSPMSTSLQCGCTTSWPRVRQRPSRRALWRRPRRQPGQTGPVPGEAAPRQAGSGGRDLIEMGVPQGPAVGEMLTMLSAPGWVGPPAAERKRSIWCKRPSRAKGPVDRRGNRLYSLMVPLVLGTSPAMRGSMATAWRIARASALKSASAFVCAHWLRRGSRRGDSAVPQGKHLQKVAHKV